MTKAMANETPLYSVGVWNIDRQAYRPLSAKWLNITKHELRRVLTWIRKSGTSSADRWRTPKGEYESDWFVLVERTDGKHFAKIFCEWER